MTTLRRLFRAVDAAEAEDADNDRAPVTLDDLARAVRYAKKAEDDARNVAATADAEHQAAIEARANAEAAFAEAVADVGLSGYQLVEATP